MWQTKGSGYRVSQMCALLVILFGGYFVLNLLIQSRTKITSLQALFPRSLKDIKLAREPESNIDIKLASMSEPNNDKIAKLRTDNATELLQRYMYNLQIHCPVAEYIGGYIDGWKVCKTTPTVDRKCKAYLITSKTSKDDRFLEELKTLRNCKGAKIYKESLQREFNGFKGVTGPVLNEKTIDILVLDRADQDKNHTEILEWLLRYGALSHVQQLHFSITVNDWTMSSDVHGSMLSLLNNLYNEGFRIYTKDVEPGKGTYFISRYAISMIRDISMVDAFVPPTKDKLKKMTNSQLYYFYYEYIISTQYLCSHIVRVGNVRDGGWDVCDDFKFRPRKNRCLVYSFGISKDWTFDDKMAEQYGCEDHAFDPSIGKPDHQRSKKVWFHNVGLSGENNSNNSQKWTMMTLDSIRRSLNHSNTIIDVMKMDIEWSEWTALPQMIATNQLKDVRQLFVEFHNNRGVDNKLYYNAAISFRQLYDIGFRIFLSHGNEAVVNIFYSNVMKRELTAGYEVYFVNINLV